ncbi:hypothetical protein [Paenibacillus sp. YYML68]|uniref:hypothetical protein n=1 Tax=Paenibacillus sp. YYML68 TaxID=2909250 RepID=UPI002490896C|nr:hypothetical protein [Paenibacillus sp. YYML68]
MKSKVSSAWLRKRQNCLVLGNESRSTRQARYLHIYLKRLTRSTSGQITLEASLTMPLIFLSTAALLGLGLLFYFESSLYHKAGEAAERTAYIWDNSSKELVTGSVHPTASDGLYWRLTSDGLSQWFNLASPMSPVAVALPASADSTAGGAVGKLARTADTLPDAWRGQLSFSHYGVLRIVRASLERSTGLSALAPQWLRKEQLDGDVKSYVVEPVETIRMVDLTRTFIAEIQGRIRPQAALAALKQPGTTPKEPTRVASHAQAAQYLRLLVGGKETQLEVKPGTLRQVDALDATGVAHQAYYTFNEKNLREVQLMKDAELLKQGTQVKGVVWHFFKLSKNDKVKLTQTLKSEIERHGIVLVFHE